MSPDCPVLVVGEALIDVIHAADGTTSEHVGGSPANVAVGLGALGHDVRMRTWVADDDRGRAVVRHLTAQGVAVEPDGVHADRTSTATAWIDPAGTATYEFDVDFRLAEPSTPSPARGHLHTGSVAASRWPAAGQVRELMAVSRASCTVSYDPNLRPALLDDPRSVQGHVEECAGLADVVKASSEDLAWLYPGVPPTLAAGELGRLGAGLVVLTQGASDLWVCLPQAGDCWQQTVPVVEVVDTVGAGDSFMAGLLSGLIEAGLLGGVDERQRWRGATRGEVAGSLERGLACAAHTVSRSGAAAPTRAELER